MNTVLLLLILGVAAVLLALQLEVGPDADRRAAYLEAQTDDLAGGVEAIAAVTDETLKVVETIRVDEQDTSTVLADMDNDTTAALNQLAKDIAGVRAAINRNGADQ